MAPQFSRRDDTADLQKCCPEPAEDRSQARRLPLSLLQRLFLLTILVLTFCCSPHDPSAAADEKPAELIKKPKLTDLYGDPLPSRATSRLGTIRLRHSDRISALDFTPDGKTVVSGGDKTIRFWDVATGKELLCLQANSSVGAVAVSLDGKTAASGHGDGSVRIWDVATAKLTRQLGVHKGAVDLVSFSQDGKLLVSSATMGHGTLLWDLTTGQQVGKVLEPGRITGVAVSPDGQTLASASEFYRDHSVRLWDLKTGKEITKFLGHKGVVFNVLFVPGGKKLASNDSSGEIRFWDLENKREAHKLQGGGGVFVFSPDGSSFITDNRYGIPVLRDTEGGREIRRFEGHQSSITAVKFSADGKTLATGSHGGVLRLWEVATGKELVNLQGFEQGPTYLSFSPDGKSLAARNYQGTVSLWDITTRKQLGTLDDSRCADGSHAFTTDGKGLYSGTGSEGKLCLWDVSTGKKRQLYQTIVSVNQLAVSPNNKMVAVSDRSRRGILLHDAATGKCLQTLTNPSDRQVTALTFSLDNKALASGSPDNVIRLWDVLTGEEKLSFSHDPGRREDERRRIIFLAFVPDGNSLLSSDGETICRWNLTTGKRTLRIIARTWWLALSPDGKILASTDNANSISLWEIATGRKIDELSGHTGTIWSLAFSPDAKTLASGEQGNTILTWDLLMSINQGLDSPLNLDQTILEKAWVQLAEQDAAVAFRVLATLASKPEQSLAFLKARLHSVQTPKPEKIRELIKHLDHEDFETRDKAYKQLEDLESQAEQLLRQALAASPSSEARKRIESLLESLAEETLSPAALRQVRLHYLLEYIASAPAIELLSVIASGSPSARLTIDSRAAIKRMKNRVEPSP